MLHPSVAVKVRVKVWVHETVLKAKLVFSAILIVATPQSSDALPAPRAAVLVGEPHTTDTELGAIKVGGVLSVTVKI